MQLVRVGLLRQDCGAVVIGKGGLDRVSVIREVEHKGVVFFGVRAVETGQRLHRLDAGKRLVDVHGVQQRFVVAGLELVGTDQETVWCFLDLVGDHVGREAIE